jgi:hypothetical protein
LTVKVKSSESSELESGIPRSAKYGAGMEAFVVRKVVVLSMRVGLQSPGTASVFICGSGSSFQQSDEQGPINIEALHTSVSRK